MAWRSSGRTHTELVHRLRQHGIIRTQRVYDALLAVDRGGYSKWSPYEDAPQTIGSGATISAPHMHAYALESLHSKLVPGAKVLDVGSGSGYLTAVMGKMVQPGGRVIGVDHITELNDQALRNVQHQSPDLLADGTVLFVTADGREGYPPEAPYDAIHVGAALQSSVQPLLDQLKPGGLLFVPEQVGSSQSVRVYERDATGKVHKQDLMGVSYIPLTDPDQQRRRYW